MAKKPTFPDGTIERMQILLRQAKSTSELKRIQCIFMGAQGISSLIIAPLVAYTPEYIRLVWQQYRKQGEAFLLGERRGQARGRAHLSVEEEDGFITPFLKEAEEGGILIVSEIHKAYEEKYKKKVYSSVIYNLLHRHDWRKIAPRPFHPKTDTEIQEEFKSFTFPPGDNKGKN